MKAVVAAFNQEKALVGAFSVITNIRMELFEALGWLVDSLCWREGRCTVSVLVMVRLVRFTPLLSELPYREPDSFRSCLPRLLPSGRSS